VTVACLVDPPVVDHMLRCSSVEHMLRCGRLRHCLMWMMKRRNVMQVICMLPACQMARNVCPAGDTCVKTQVMTEALSSPCCSSIWDAINILPL